ncbi:msr6022 [Mesorhizobium japonicum MAFF 303099]|uniref:Msr6022 protein n=1 Tax=Mesorhizobium japonicum (strain LMG 29417 / CECT 9101 / MAFF 303099) TaxID=266835 RepID=Q98AF5_RHILO|nr:msr6022 [Mesorhizobium japonicum MAFF 303099]
MRSALANGAGASRPTRAVLDACWCSSHRLACRSRREKTPICKLNWTRAAAGYLLPIEDMALDAASRNSK